MLLAGLRRLILIVGVLMAVTAAASLVLGALAHANLGRAVADGFYVVGCAVLLGSFVLGVRGPLRADWGDPTDSSTGGGIRGGMLQRRIRKSTPEERVEARRYSVGLFALGILFIMVGGAVDPTRRFF